jgi:LPS O-antigen subunit length determinant protein (WzzB/FepE family)
MTISRINLLILTVCFILSGTLSSAFGEEAWRTDFDTACAQSNEAMALSVSELQKLIEQCDRLQKIIETKEETMQKVFLKRLQMCRNLLVFVLETKKQEQK